MENSKPLVQNHEQKLLDKPNDEEKDEKTSEEFRAALLAMRTGIGKLFAESFKEGSNHV